MSWQKIGVFFAIVGVVAGLYFPIANAKGLWPFASLLEQFSVTIGANEHGTTNPRPGTYSYDAGTQLSVEAIPDSGYELDSWSGGYGSSKTLLITVSRDISITASFKQSTAPSPPTPVSIASYKSDDDSVADVYGYEWWAQTFTTGSGSQKVTSIRLKLYSRGKPGIVRVSIRETSSNGTPTGPDQTFATLDASDRNNVNLTPGWVTFTVTEYYLSRDTRYAIVFRAPSGDSSNKVCWHFNSAGGYIGGQYYWSTNGGLTWAAPSGADFMFEVLGEP